MENTNLTAKQKMLGGFLYNPNDPELTADRQRAWRLLCEYEQTFAPRPCWEELLARRLPWLRNPASSVAARQQRILTKLLGAVGENVAIAPGFRCDYGYQITVGAGSFFNYDCVILDCGLVTIGAGVFFGPGVHIIAVNHPLNSRERHQPENTQGFPVTIGDNVWIGDGAKIRPGVTVGDEAIIGINAVVTSDVAPGTIVGGVPAHLMRKVP